MRRLVVPWLVLAPALCLPRLSLAQDTPRRLVHPLKSVGLEAGLSSTSLSPANPTTSSRTRGLFGVVFAGDGSFTWQAEVVVAAKGVRISTTDVSSWYLEAPLLARFNMRADRTVRPFVIAGAVPAVRIADSLGSRLRGYDVGATIGGGVSTRRWAISARYTQGLVATHIEIDGHAMRNVVASLVFAVRLN